MTTMSKVEAAFCRSAPWRSFARRVALPWALQDATLGTDVLEIGGGSGAMAYELLAREPRITLTVADIDPSMVAAASRRLQPFASRSTCIESDAGSLAVSDHDFDTVCTWLMLHHTITWPAVLSEAARALRPGGTLIGYDLTDSAPARLLHRADRSEHQLIRAHELEAELEGLGFVDITVETAFGGTVMRFRAQRPL